MTVRQISRASMMRKFGTAAFLFFLVKGVLWLVAAGAVLVSAL